MDQQMRITNPPVPGGGRTCRPHFSGGGNKLASVPFPDISAARSGLIAGAIGFSQPTVIESSLYARVRRQSQPPASSRPNPLLHLPAVGDNAAMETEPTKAEPTKRKRRLFQFSLRTLMIVMTLTALAEPLLIWAWDATRPRIQCSDLLKPINLPLAQR